MFGCQGRRFLSLLVANKDPRLSESGLATLKGYVQLLEHLRRQIPDFQRRGQAKGELHGSVIEKRASILEAVRRRRAIVHQDQRRKGRREIDGAHLIDK